MELRNKKKNLQDRIMCEHRFIAKCIFQGLTISQIAKRLNCSESTVSNRLNGLFKKYKAKNRFEFIISVFGQIIENQKIIQHKIELENLKLRKSIETLLKKTKA